MEIEKQDWRRLLLTESQKAQVELMEKIAQALYDKPLILKGGTALVLGYGLDRFSEDLDFDAPKVFKLGNTLQKAIPPEFNAIIDTAKNTTTSQRYKIHYSIKRPDGQMYHNDLKIDISFRLKDSLDFTDIYEKNHIKFMPLSKILDSKLAMVLGKNGRTKARDLYDINFILKTYFDQVSLEQAQFLAQNFNDMEYISSVYGPAFKDAVLFRDMDHESIILSIDESVDRLASKFQLVRG